MPFKFDLGVPEPIVEGSWDYAIDFTLGYDTDFAERVMMSVALLQDGGGDAYELVFGIRKAGIYSGRVTPYAFDHQTARQYVSRRDAEPVILLVLRCVRLLVEAVKPGVVVMESFEADLPVAAMGKYMRVCNHMGRCGYTMTEYWRDGTDRKDYWLFTL